MSNAPERDSTEQQLATVCESLGVPDSTVERARERLSRLRNVPALEDRRWPVVGAAVLSLTCREDGLPILVADIAAAWSQTLPGDERIEPEEMTGLFGTLVPELDRQGTPPQPRALIERYGDDLGLSDGVIVVANRLLVDLFAEAPDLVADGDSLHGTVGAILYIAAKLNGVDEVTESKISDVLGTGQVTVHNRSRTFRDTLGKERLAGSDRYLLPTDTNGASEGEDAPRADAAEASGEVAATDGAADPGDADDDPADAGGDGAVASADGTTDAAGDDAPQAGDGDAEAVVRSLFPDELPTTDRVAEEMAVAVDAAASQLEAGEADGELERNRAGTTDVWLPGDREGLTPDLTEDAVQHEVDEIVDALELDASLRVFARGLVSDAVDSLSVENAAEMGGAAVLAACRVQDIEVDATEIADAGEFEARVLYTWVEKLAESVDVDVPRPEPETFAERFAESLDMTAAVEDASLDALETFEPPEDDHGFTAPELAAGAIAFAAVVDDGDLDAEAVSEASGVATEHVEATSEAILASLSRSLVLGEVDEEEDWTTDLLAVEVPADVGADTRATVTLAKSYVAGRDGESLNEDVVDAVVPEPEAAAGDGGDDGEAAED
jgi:transcription initiation factor TFIIIB Brf1 subunit/transcription initiation factor TFIIB